MAREKKEEYRGRNRDFRGENRKKKKEERLVRGNSLLRKRDKRHQFDIQVTVRSATPSPLWPESQMASTTNGTFA